MFGLSVVLVIFERTFPKSVSSGCLIRYSKLLVWCPQGLVLIFTIYTRPRGIIARRFGVGYHFYADDTQLYVSPDVGNESKVP